MYIDNNNNFYGKINGKDVDYFFKRAIKKKTYCKKDKQDLVKNVLNTEVINGKEFYDEFFEEIFNQDTPYGIKLILSKSDSLYSTSNVAYLLELLGTIWLESVKKKDDKKNYIKVYDSESLFQRALKEESVFNDVAHSSGGDSEAQSGNKDFAMLVLPQNYRLEKEWKSITHSEIKEYAKKYSVLNDLYDTFDNLNKKIINILFDENNEKKELTNKEERYVKRLNRYKTDVKKEILHYVNYNMGIIKFKQPLPDKGEPSWDEFDDTNPKHLRALAQIKPRQDLQDDLACMVRDLNNTISLCEFTDIQKEVLYWWREDKSQQDIANILDVKQQMIDQHLNAIFNKIANKNWELYEDWYYLNICYGRYKKCSKCNEIKLIQQFNKKNSSKDGYDTKCRECFNKNRNK